MRIKQMSDLHLEFDADFFPENKESADILMLNGDICIAQYFEKGENSPYSHKADLARHFFERVSNEYDHILYVPGNHEHYRGYIDRTDNILIEELSQFSNIHYLNESSWEFGGFTFLGATLWTNMNNNSPITEQYLMGGMNDFRIVQWKKDGYGGKFRPSDAAAIHRRTLKFFDEASADKDNVIIMSHHAPSFKSVHPKYHNDTHMNYGYYSDLDEFILDRPQIKLWTHGHMHDCFSYNIGTTKILCNPRGYHNENKFFKIDQVIEL